LDTDFDALFNLDADMDFLAANENEGTAAALSSHTDELSRNVDWTTFNAASVSETMPSFSQQRRLVDLVPDPRISVQA
jgi:hypothetical protein